MKTKCLKAPPGLGLRQSNRAKRLECVQLAAAFELFASEKRQQAARTPSASRELDWRSPKRVCAFTLLELLVVIAIVGLLAALTAPVLNNFRPNYAASATAQLMDAMARGRQLAISQRTTVYMVFVPTNLVIDPALSPLNSNARESARVAKLYDKQGIGYNFVSLHSMGDQPGRPTVRYLDAWRSLPEGAFIYPGKFAPNSQSFTIWTNIPPQPGFVVTGFNRSSSFTRSSSGVIQYTPAIPFPDEDAQPYSPQQPYVQMPYIAWDYMGRLASGRDEIIPLSKGAVTFSHNANNIPTTYPPTFNEQPPGNATNSVTYNVVVVDWITGRARAIHQEVR